MYSANTGGWSKPSSLLAAIFGLAPFSSRTRTISARFATLSAQATCRAEPRIDEVLLTSAPKLTRLINFSIYSSMTYSTFSYRLQWASWRAQRPLSAQLNPKLKAWRVLDHQVVVWLGLLVLVGGWPLNDFPKELHSEAPIDNHFARPLGHLHQLRKKSVLKQFQ